MNIKKLEKLLEEISQVGWVHVSRMIESDSDESPDIATFNPSVFNQDNGNCEEEYANAHLASLAPTLAVEVIDNHSEIKKLKQEVNALTSDINALRAGLAIPKSGFMRLSQVLKFIPVSKTAFYDGIRKGIYPAQVKIGVRASAWRCEDINSLIKSL